MMDQFTIDQNDNGFHIHGLPYHWQGNLIVPLYHSFPTYAQCIEWLNIEYPNGYEIVEKEKLK